MNKEQEFKKIDGEVKKDFYQKTTEDYKLWLRSAARDDKEYLELVKNFTDEESKFFYNTFMTFTLQVNKKFVEFVKNYKEIY